MRVSRWLAFLEMRRIHHILAAALGLILLYTIALGARRMVLEAQYRQLGDELPFTLESALQYRRVKIAHDTGRIPAVDFSIQYPEGVNTRTSYTLGSEYLFAVLADVFPGSVPFPNRLRWLESLWFCLGIPLLALWVRIWRRSWWAAGVAGLFYAVSLSSVIRSTGQELSRENFALPILIAHFLAEAISRRSWRVWSRVAWQAVSALLLALALCSWDLVQYAVMLRMAVFGWRVAWGRTRWLDAEFQGWLWMILALAVTGAVSPYYRARLWSFSPAMVMGYASLAVALLPALRTRSGWWRFSIWSSTLALALFLLHFTPFGSAYGHFGELLWAKLRFLNQKPADPALLTFEQRIMWVPALHSMTPVMMETLFPAILYLTCPAFLLVFWQSRKRTDLGVGELLFSFGVSFVASWFFARFHVYLSLFACVLLGVWAGSLSSYRFFAKLLLSSVIGAGLFAETLHTVRKPERWGRINVYYKELDELADWLRAHVAPDPVLANFGVSGYIAAYGKCAILLHPKFEDPVIRDRVREYGELLFKGTEKSFRDWADNLGARYYVYALGEFAKESPELQMRYFVDALNPPATAPACLFEAGKKDLTYFRFLWGNRKYAVYQMLTKVDENLAMRAAARAEKQFQSGDLAGAESDAVEALRLNPHELQAAEILGHVSALREAGFDRPAAKE